MAGKRESSKRKCVKGHKSLEKKYKRTAFTTTFKKDVLDHFGINGMASTINKFWPGVMRKTQEYESRRKLVYQWKSKAQFISINFDLPQKKKKIFKKIDHVVLHA